VRERVPLSRNKEEFYACMIFGRKRKERKMTTREVWERSEGQERA
jgi:hypothetical protein